MGRGDGHLCAPLAGGIAAPCALATPAPPPPLPLPPLYSAAGGGRGLEEGGWRSRPAPAHPRRLCPARSPEEGEGGAFAAATARCAAALASPLSHTAPSFSASPFSPCFLPPSLLPLPFRPPPPSRPFAAGGGGGVGGWGGVSLGIIGPRRCRQSGRAGCPRLPAPPPSGGNGKDTHHAPLNLPSIPVSATPPRAVGSRGFPSGPAPVAGTESARRGSPCGQVLPPGVGTQRTQRCALTQGCRGALEGLIAICRRAAAAPGREVRGQLCWTFLTAGPPTLFEGLDPRPRAGLRSRPLPSRCRLCAAGVIRGAAATLSLSQPATAGAE